MDVIFRGDWSGARVPSFSPSGLAKEPGSRKARLDTEKASGKQGRREARAQESRVIPPSGYCPGPLGFFCNWAKAANGLVVWAFSCFSGSKSQASGLKAAPGARG